MTPPDPPAAPAPPIPRVILITDPSYSLDHVARVVEQVAKALGPAAFMVQLRDKTSIRPVFLQAARRLRQVTTDTGALLCLNAIRKDGGFVIDVAEQVGADALHVPCNLHMVVTAQTVAKWVSVPTHTDAEARAAQSSFAQAVLVSPIFATPGKGPPRGLAPLGLARQLRPRVYALGGVTPVKAEVCAHAGAHGVAVIRALLSAEEPVKVALDLAKPFLDPAEGV